MSSTNIMRMTDSGPPVPARGTLPSAANQFFAKGTLVTQNSSGYAVSPSSADTSGNPAVGVSNQTYDNRTGAEAGGTAGDLDIEFLYGVFGFDYTGTAPVPGDKLYVVDNQTVSIDSLNGTRGEAGVCCEVRTIRGTAQAFLYIGPLAMSERGGDAVISLDQWRVASSGAAVAAFSNGVADGYSLVSSEAFGIRFNDDTTAALATSVLLPADLDGSKPVVFHALGFRTGTLDTTAALTIGAFMVSVGDLATADADAGGATSAFDAAAANTVQEVTRTLAATDVPEGPSVLTLTMVPTAALDDDDLVILKAWISYSKR